MEVDDQAAVAGMGASFDTGRFLSSVGLGLAGEWLGYRRSFWLSAGTVAAAVSANCLPVRGVLPS